jgi:hypothetical protein
MHFDPICGQLAGDQGCGAPLFKGGLWVRVQGLAQGAKRRLVCLKLSEKRCGDRGKQSLRCHGSSEEK